MVQIDNRYKEIYNDMEILSNAYTKTQKESLSNKYNIHSFKGQDIKNAILLKSLQ